MRRMNDTWPAGNQEELAVLSGSHAPHGPELPVEIRERRVSHHLRDRTDRLIRPRQPRAGVADPHVRDILGNRSSRMF